MSLLEVTDLRIRYVRQGRLKAALRREPRDFEAVCGVSFQLDPGQTLGLVGESGSGKSTIARTLIGLKKSSGGSIRFDGAEISDASARDWGRLRREMSMMWQDPVGSLSPRLTVKALVTEPLRINGMKASRAEAVRLLSLVGLPPEFANRYPHQLSGGQARRVGVARALALDPKLLIADEPTAGLDMSVQGEVLNLLAEVQARSGVAIVIITHNLNLVRHVTDQMAIMYLGRFVEQGPTEQIFAQPRHPYTKALLEANPEPDPEARQDYVPLSGEVPSPVNRPTGCDFHPRCVHARPDCAARVPDWTEEGARGHRCMYPL
ncbi:oligopeptide/dipeptide ABC transporter ATP-binding protein [Chachezhania antarctica]|uniref:oligopeptide/dipeptide ABC transporter ATP-binding protein n=1 Tax=Chachezhania antarctica TaxID=2340860 RepID=UPI000EB48528|nr:ABC transporter ATP-binding protein [Chachezhania antarctica]|tara:strand:- start:4644 stop:5603 length:960 start_codon:yes stop_codon:yes gene_type:complete